MKNTFFAVCSLLSLAACQGASEPKNTAAPAVSSLAGHKALLTYPAMKAEIKYLTDSTLHWKTTSAAGEVAEGDEKVFARKLNDHQFFLNWIEQDGYTVSQIIDLQDNTVISYTSYADDQSPRGQRSAMPLTGSFELLPE